MTLFNRSKRYTAGNICLVLFAAFLFSMFAGAIGEIESAWANTTTFADGSTTMSISKEAGQNFEISLKPVTERGGFTLKLTNPLRGAGGATEVSSDNFTVAEGIYKTLIYILTGTPEAANVLVPLHVYYGQENVPDTVYVDLTIKPPDNGHGGGGGGGGFIPPIPQPQQPTENKVNVGTSTSATISTDKIAEIAKGKEPLVVEGIGVKFAMAPQVLGALEANTTLEVGARALSTAEKSEVLAGATLGQARGLFEIGGKMVNLTAQTVNPTTGTKDKIASFAEPVAVTIDLSDVTVSDEDVAMLTAVRFEKDEAGKTITTKLGGTYDAATKTFTFHTNKFSYYSVLKATELTKINLGINKLTTQVNGQAGFTDVPPTIINNRTMVPLRFVGESLGAKVEWMEATRTVKITLDGQTISLVIGETTAELDVPATIIGGRTLVPIRYVSESLGANVLWFPSTQTVQIVK